MDSQPESILSSGISLSYIVPNHVISQMDGLGAVIPRKDLSILEIFVAVIQAELI
jgi:hypothetical protein